MTRHRKRKRKRRHSRRGGAQEREEEESEEDEEESEPVSQRPKRNQHSEISSLSASLSGAPSKVTDTSPIKKSSLSPQATVREGPVTPQKGFTEYKDDEQGKGTFRTQPHSYIVAWQKRVQEWYPQISQQTYFLPSVFMHRMHLKEKQAAGHDVLQINPPLTVPKVTGCILDKDVREDRAHQNVLDSLQKLQHEVMFVISQLQFGNYLGEPAYAAAAKLFPRPHDPVLASKNKDQGDFDILVIHRQYGVLVGEIKSVGDSFFLSLSSEEQDAILIKRVKEAIKQLTKSRDVLKFIVPCDGYLQVRIQTTLMLPNITASQLSRALSGCEQTKKDLCEVLGVDSCKDPASLCLTSDDLENPGPWWSRVVTSSDTDPAMSDSVYLDLVARFCGPATTVTVHCPSLPRRAASQRSSLRSTGDGVAETARRFAPSDIMLHPMQVALLNKQQPLVYVAGPPGTGKTIVLVLKAMEWLRQGKWVHVVSTQPDSLAASYMIVAQLKEARDDSKDRISLCVCDLTRKDDQEALTELENLAENGELYIIADEVYTSRNFRSKSATTFRSLCVELTRRVEGLHFWAASVYHGIGPPFFKQVVMTEPLRSPPRVTREIKQSGYMNQDVVRPYTTPPGPLPAEGPTVVSLLHEGKEHSTGTPYQCEECGRRIAKTMLELGVCPAENPTSTSSEQAPLRCRDVFILTGDHGLSEFRLGTASTPPSGLLESRLGTTSTPPSGVPASRLGTASTPPSGLPESRLGTASTPPSGEPASRLGTASTPPSGLPESRLGTTSTPPSGVPASRLGTASTPPSGLPELRLGTASSPPSGLPELRLGTASSPPSGLPESHPGIAFTAQSGLLRGVQGAGFPLTLVNEDDVMTIEEVATMSGPDRVVVAQSNAVSGLERPVVVWVQGDKESLDQEYGRLNAMSRATAQLIWVRKPP